MGHNWKHTIQRKCQIFTVWSCVSVVAWWCTLACNLVAGLGHWWRVLNKKAGLSNLSDMKQGRARASWRTAYGWRVHRTLRAVPRTSYIRNTYAPPNILVYVPGLSCTFYTCVTSSWCGLQPLAQQVHLVPHLAKLMSATPLLLLLLLLCPAFLLPEGRRSFSSCKNNPGQIFGQPSKTPVIRILSFLFWETLFSPWWAWGDHILYRTSLFNIPHSWTTPVMPDHVWPSFYIMDQPWTWNGMRNDVLRQVQSPVLCFLFLNWKSYQRISKNLKEVWSFLCKQIQKMTLE